MKRARIPACILLFSVLLFQGCATLGEIARTLTSLKNLQFRLDDISDFSLAGIGIGPKSQLGDFTLADGIQLLAAFRNRRLPASFLLNVEARNPNDGTGGSTRTVSTLTRFDWRLLIDDRPTISGGIDKPAWSWTCMNSSASAATRTCSTWPWPWAAAAATCRAWRWTPCPASRPRWATSPGPSASPSSAKNSVELCKKATW